MTCVLKRGVNTSQVRSSSKGVLVLLIGNSQLKACNVSLRRPGSLAVMISPALTKFNCSTGPYQNPGILDLTDNQNFYSNIAPTIMVVAKFKNTQVKEKLPNRLTIWSLLVYSTKLQLYRAKSCN